MTTTFGVSQDDYLRSLIASNQILLHAVVEVRYEANKGEDPLSKRIHSIAQEAIERVTQL